jgi:hypothetical protein
MIFLKILLWFLVACVFIPRQKPMTEHECYRLSFEFIGILLCLTILYSFGG